MAQKVDFILEEDKKEVSQFLNTSKKKNGPRENSEVDNSSMSLKSESIDSRA